VPVDGLLRKVVVQKATRIRNEFTVGRHIERKPGSRGSKKESNYDGIWHPFDLAYYWNINPEIERHTSSKISDCLSTRGNACIQGNANKYARK